MRRNDESIRHRVAVEAARMLYHREVKEYFHAKREAARRQGTIHLPSNREVHDQLLLIARQVEGDEHIHRLQHMRGLALRLMELLEPFHPKLIGSTLTGHIRRGSDVDLNVYAEDLEPILEALVDYRPTVNHVHGRKGDFTHVHLDDVEGVDVEVTLYPLEDLHEHPRCGITGEPMRRATLNELRQLLQPRLTPSFPELDACRGVLQNDYHHLDVYHHTLLVVENLQGLLDSRFEAFPTHQDALARHLSTPESRELLLLAGYWHDVGKPATQSWGRDGRIHFYGHELKSAELAARRQLPRDLVKLVATHMQPVLLPGSDAPPSEFHAMFAAVGERLPELALLSVADVAAARGPAQGERRQQDQLEFANFMLDEFFDYGPLAHPDLPLDEDDLRETFGELPVKTTQRLLGELRSGWLDGIFESREEGLSLAAELL